jgi:hypothetical protein
VGNQELDRCRNPILLRLLKPYPPAAELVRIFDLPRHAFIYSSYGMLSRFPFTHRACQAVIFHWCLASLCRAA